MSETDIDHVTWVALAKCYRIAEAALTALSSFPDTGEAAKAALAHMREEVDACEKPAPPPPGWGIRMDGSHEILTEDEEPV